jgi:SAM-dependent methyltransferase
MAVRNRPYSLLARFYDELVPGVPEMNRHARERILAPHWKEIGRVVEIACGNGATAVDLARKGLEVEALDWSPTFVKATRKRAKAAKVSLRARRGDMRRFAVARPADLVICEFAALNNLARRGDLAPTLRCFARATKPGGLLLFDVNSPLAFRTQTPHEMKQSGRGFEVVMRGRSDRSGLRTRLDFEWTLRPRRSSKPLVETIWHVAWSTAELRRALRAAGFGSIRVFDGVDVRPPMEGAKRRTDLYFLARRETRGLGRAVTTRTAATARASPGSRRSARAGRRR